MLPVSPSIYITLPHESVSDYFFSSIVLNKLFLIFTSPAPLFTLKTSFPFNEIYFISILFILSFPEFNYTSPAIIS
jgi:hypothetical protein